MSSRYDTIVPPPPHATLDSLDKRLQHVEQMLLRLDAQLTPRWLRVSGWGAFLGSALAAAIKLWLHP